MKIIFLNIILLFFISIKLYSQEADYKSNAIRTGLGFGINDSKKETGSGMLYSIGWNKALDKKQKLRLNPNLLLGGFSMELGLGPRDQYYRTTSYGLNIHYDLIRYKAISIVTSLGGFANYSRGLLGTGGDPEATVYKESEYFYSIYFGGKISAGLRINPKKKRIAYEIRPINIQFGNSDFMLIYFMFGVDIKLKNNK